MLIKDYQTGRGSLTVTCFVISFLFALIVGVALLYKLLNNRLEAGEVAFGFYSLSFMGVFVSLYWNKRVRFSREGLEINDYELPISPPKQD